MQAAHSSRRHASPAGGGGSCAPWKPTAPTTCPTACPVDALTKPCTKHCLPSLPQAWHGGFSSATAATARTAAAPTARPHGGPAARPPAHGQGGRAWQGRVLGRAVHGEHTPRRAKQARRACLGSPSLEGCAAVAPACHTFTCKGSNDRREWVSSVLAPAWGAAPPTAPPR